MDLLVTGQRMQIVLYDPRKTRKVLPQSVEPTGNRFASPRYRDIAKPIGAAVGYRAEPKEAIIA